MPVEPRGCPPRPPSAGQSRQRPGAFMLGLGPMALSGEEVSGVGVQRRWVWRLIAGRVLAAAVVLGTFALWTGVASQGELGRLGGGSAIALVVLVLSAAYALVLRFTKVRPRAQAGAQFAL